MAEFLVQHPYHSQGLASGGSALLDAVNRGQVHLAKFLLDATIVPNIVNTRDFNGKTPLLRCCYVKEEKTRDKLVRLLLERGADVNLQDDLGRTTFSYACEMRCNDVVRILVKNNVLPELADNKGNTALMYSCTVGNDTATEIILRSFRRLGLNVDHFNKDGCTALMLAATNRNWECASLLALEGKADLALVDPLGQTAEQLAIANGASRAQVLPFSVTSKRWNRCKAARYNALVYGEDIVDDLGTAKEDMEFPKVTEASTGLKKGQGEQKKRSKMLNRCDTTVDIPSTKRAPNQKKHLQQRDSASNTHPQGTQSSFSPIHLCSGAMGRLMKIKPSKKDDSGSDFKRTKNKDNISVKTDAGLNLINLACAEETKEMARPNVGRSSFNERRLNSMDESLFWFKK